MQISTKKQAFDFSKRNSSTNACLKLLCDAKLITPLLMFAISSKKLKTVYLSFHWFNDSRTCGFDHVTCKFELINREFELATRALELVTRRFELVTRRFEPVTHGFELVTRGFILVTRGFELITRWFGLSLLNFNSRF